MSIAPLQKKIVTGITAIVVILGIAFFAVGANIDSIVKAAIEKVGTDATQTKLSLAAVKIVPSTGLAEIDGLKIDNPKGFKSDSAIKIGKIAVTLDKASILAKGPIVIKSVVIEEPELTYEVVGATDSNLQALQRNIAAYTGSAPAKSASGKEDVKKESESRKVVIEDLSVNGGKVNLRHEALKQGLTAKLPAIHMTKIGQDGGGLSQAAVARLILNQLSTAAVDAGSTEIVKQLKGQALESVKGAIEQSPVGKGVTDIVKGVTGIGGKNR